MRLLFIAIITAVLVMTPAFAGGSANGSTNGIQFSKAPAMNVSVSGTNLSINFFHPSLINSHIVKNPLIKGIYNCSGFNTTDIGKSHNLTFGKIVKSRFNEIHRGTMNVTYKGFLEEKITEVNVITPLSIFNAKPTYYIYINMTVNIFINNLNTTLTGTNGTINLQTNNTLRIVYSLEVHSTFNKSIGIMIPESFSQSNNNVLPENISKEKTKLSGQLFNGFIFGMKDGKKISFVYNNTYYNNNQKEYLSVKKGFISQEHEQALNLIFHTKGKYSNITYDPYLVLPVKNVTKDIAVTYAVNDFIRILISNSIFLTSGLVIGIAIIGSGYYYRKKTH
jgi:hypothetical protein